MDERDHPVTPEESAPAPDGEPAASTPASQSEASPPASESAAPQSESAEPAQAPEAAADAAPASEPAQASEPAPEAAPAPALEPASAVRATRGDWLAERPETVVEIGTRRLRSQSRRDFLLFAAGTAVAAAGAWWLLPDRAKARLLPGAHDRLDTLAARVGLSRESRERVLDRALTFDDDVAEALYSKERRVRTYSISDVTALRNNYHGGTPGPGILDGWTLTLSGLASGEVARLALEQLLAKFPLRDQVTRLVCVEGWSGIAWWGGIPFPDLLAAFPPAPEARWAALRSTVSLDERGRPEPYYVSIDLGTARHPQTLLATHYRGRPLTLAHGAPLRLVAPMKLGLKNIKAITEITYSAEEPPDYWNERGYSKYDGL